MENLSFRHTCNRHQRAATVGYFIFILIFFGLFPALTGAVGKHRMRHARDPAPWQPAEGDDLQMESYIPLHAHCMPLYQRGLAIPPECFAPKHSDFSDESRLISHLLRKLNPIGPLARPVTNSSLAVPVQFSMSLVQILDFAETRQLLITNVWKNFQWADEILRWEPKEFGGIRDIRLPPEMMWTPDVVLYNNADEQYEREQHREYVAVFSDGTVKWIPSSIYKSSCQVDMSQFPFDTQTCFFKFGSWTYDGLKLNLTFLNNNRSIDFGEFVPSSEWNIIDTDGYLQIRHYACCGDDPYPEIMYSITVKRRTAFYIVVLLLPCVLLSLLTLLMFWYPPSRPDRTGLGMSLFSSFFVLLLILVQASPPTALSISYLGVYYCVNMVLIALATTLSVIVINFQQMKGRLAVVPACLLQWRKRRLTELAGRACGALQTTGFGPDGNEVPEPTHNGPLHANDRGQVVVDWEYIATIFDRICFVIYVIFFFVSITFIFPR